MTIRLIEMELGRFIGVARRRQMRGLLSSIIAPENQLASCTCLAFLSQAKAGQANSPSLFDRQPISCRPCTGNTGDMKPLREAAGAAGECGAPETARVILHAVLVRALLASNKIDDAEERGSECDCESAPH